jgi:hypothetical protein
MKAVAAILWECPNYGNLMAGISDVKEVIGKISFLSPAAKAALKVVN